MTPIQLKRTKPLLVGLLLLIVTVVISACIVALPPFVAGLYPYIFLSGLNETGIFLYLGLGVLLGLGLLLFGVLWIFKVIAKHWKLAEYDCRLVVMI